MASRGTTDPNVWPTEMSGHTAAADRTSEQSLNALREHKRGRIADEPTRQMRARHTGHHSVPLSRHKRTMEAVRRWAKRQEIVYDGLHMDVVNCGESLIDIRAFYPKKSDHQIQIFEWNINMCPSNVSAESVDLVDFMMLSRQQGGDEFIKAVKKMFNVCEGGRNLIGIVSSMTLFLQTAGIDRRVERPRSFTVADAWDTGLGETYLTSQDIKDLAIRVTKEWHGGKCNPGHCPEGLSDNEIARYNSIARKVARTHPRLTPETTMEKWDDLAVNGYYGLMFDRYGHVHAVTDVCC